MKTFVGTKRIKATPMTRGAFISIYGDKLNSSGPKDEEGYLVGYPNDKGNFDGSLRGGCHYISWSPAKIFNAVYKEEK